MFSLLKKFFSTEHQKEMNTLCFTEDGKVKIFSSEIYEFDFNGIWLDIDKIKSAIPNIDCLVFSHWKCCFLNCSYCLEKKTDDLSTVKHFDIMPIVQQLIDSDLVSKDTQLIFNCGDSTLHPEFDKLMYYFINYGMKNIVLHTSAMRFCQSVADAMIQNIIQVVISLDSGCPYIYEKVKGVNKYDIAISNIKRYLQFEDKISKKVVLNYTIINTVNDNKKEILDWFIFARNLGVRKLSIDIDSRWYNELKTSIPTHLMELVIFVKELSDINCFEIEFSKNIKTLFKNL